MTASRQFQWYRFESKSTVKSAEKIPFDLFYLIPDHQVEEFSRVYPVFFAFKMPDAFLSDLLARRLHEYHCTGMGRHDGSVKKFERYDKENGRLLSDNINPSVLENLSSGKAFLCVATKARVRNGKLTPAYMLNRTAMAELNARHGHNLVGNVGKGGHKIKELISEMAVYVNGEPLLPCAICSNGIRKLSNDSYCSFGTSECLEKMRLSGVETFSDKYQRGGNDVAGV